MTETPERMKSRDPASGWVISRPFRAGFSPGLLPPVFFPLFLPRESRLLTVVIEPDLAVRRSERIGGSGEEGDRANPLGTNAQTLAADLGGTDPQRQAPAVLVLREAMRSDLPVAH